MDKALPFGGITVLFGGDFRQVLPVVPRGSREQIINASLRRSHLWSSVHLYHLTQNMCLDQSPESQGFENWLLEVGAGQNLPEDKSISLPQNLRLEQNTLESLIHHLYPDIQVGPKPDGYFQECTILSTTNDVVDEINHDTLAKFPREESTLMSVDKVVGVTQDYPMEYLNSLNVSGLPLAYLKLKPGCPLMLLWNIDQPNGLCNGTQMILTDIRPRVL